MQAILLLALQFLVSTLNFFLDEIIFERDHQHQHPKYNFRKEENNWKEIQQIPFELHQLCFFGLDVKNQQINEFKVKIKIELKHTVKSWYPKWWWRGLASWCRQSTCLRAIQYTLLTFPLTFCISISLRSIWRRFPFKSNICKWVFFIVKKSIKTYITETKPKKTIRQKQSRL